MSVFRKQTIRKGNVIYEEVLQKNFEVIETFLKKFHQIFTKQDQFEQQLNKFTGKLTQYQELLDEFKQEQKMNLVMLEKKVSNMKNSARQSHRGSNRFSKANITIFDSMDSPEGNKNYTQLKFDSIQTQIQQRIDAKMMKKQNQNTGISTKQYEVVKESIESVKKELAEMKDKINFLSVYTSSNSYQESNSRNDSLKKQITESLENHLKSKIEKEIKKEMIDTEKLFLQQINNLAIQFHDELTNSVDKRYQKISTEIQNLDEMFFNHEQAENLKEELHKDIKKFASECMQIFSNKQEAKMSLNLLDRKVKIIENSLKESLNRPCQENQQMGVFRSAFQMNSLNNQQAVSKQSLMRKLSKSCKSHSQIIKHKNHSSSLALEDNQKENNPRSRKTNPNEHDPSQGSLFTSKISKEFMKNFGLNQRKLIKTNHQTKKDKNEMNLSQTEKPIVPPQTLIISSLEVF